MEYYGVLDDLKLSLRIDGNADDVTVKRCLDAAEAFIQHAISSNIKDSFIADNPDTEALYLSAVYALASTYFTNRTSVASYTVYDIDAVTASIIGQLRGEYDYFIERTDSNETL